jgi:hypothetical protein
MFHLQAISSIADSSAVEEWNDVAVVACPEVEC